jgi:hypothetical protein
MQRKSKSNIHILPQKIGPAERQQLLDNITQNDTYLPESILHKDLDKGFLDFVKNELQVSDGEGIIPVNEVLFTVQRWAEFSQTWNHTDAEGNPIVPFVVVVRKPDPQPGSHPALQYTIPDRKQFTYQSVPVWTGQEYSKMIYKMPQPVPIDIEFDVVIVCNKLRDLNRFNKVVLQKFSSRQAYAQLKGHFIPIVLDNLSDESHMDNVDERKYYQQTYNFRMEGFLIDEKEFEIVPAVNRARVDFSFTEETKVQKTTTSVGGVEVTVKNFVADGNTTLFSVGERIGVLMCVTLNGQTQTRNADYLHNDNTSNIIFTTPPAKNTSVSVFYVSRRFVYVNGSRTLYLVTADKTSDGSSTVLIHHALQVVFVSVNGILHNSSGFNQNGTELTITSGLANGDELTFYALSPYPYDSIFQ